MQLIAIKGSFQVDGERVKRKKRVRSRKMRGDSAGVTRPGVIEEERQLGELAIIQGKEYKN
jgi:hypothetical protein